jgi:hypothetical protein
MSCSCTARKISVHQPALVKSISNEEGIGFLGCFSVLLDSDMAYLYVVLPMQNIALPKPERPIPPIGPCAIVSRLQQSHHEIPQYRWLCFLLTTMQERTLGERLQ